LGWLTQGIYNIKGTNYISFIPYKDIPKGKKIAYARIVYTIRLLNSVLSTPRANNNRY